MTKLVNGSFSISIDSTISSVTAAELATVKAGLEVSIQTKVNARILPVAI